MQAISVHGCQTNVLSAISQIFQKANDKLPHGLQIIHVVLPEITINKLIGTGGRNLREICESHNVEISASGNTINKERFIKVSGNIDNLNRIMKTMLDYLKQDIPPNAYYNLNY